MELSKRDLFNIAFSYAMRLYGENLNYGQLLKEMKKEKSLLKNNDCDYYIKVL